jgi:hypothetical protein
MFGLFYYRSANRRTLDVLGQFMPVPADALVAEFGAGAKPVDICARSLLALRAAGARHFYVSNLPEHDAAATLHAILARADAMKSA